LVEELLVGGGEGGGDGVEVGGLGGGAEAFGEGGFDVDWGGEGCGGLGELFFGGVGLTLFEEFFEFGRGLGREFVGFWGLFFGLWGLLVGLWRLLTGLWKSLVRFCRSFWRQLFSFALLTRALSVRPQQLIQLPHLLSHLFDRPLPRLHLYHFLLPFFLFRMFTFLL
jgi:hypothetical protein